MLNVLATLSRLFGLRAADGGTLPRLLLASADHRAGRDPRHAHELRLAAYAAMRVVR